MISSTSLDVAYIDPTVTPTGTLYIYDLQT